ncbi:Uncharacterized protein PBTT_06987 [Plasmodiophora brassicae]
MKVAPVFADAVPDAMPVRRGTLVWLLLLLVTPPAIVFVPMWFIGLHDPTPALESTQAPWIVVLALLALPPYVIRPISNVNLFHDEDAFLFTDVRRGIVVWVVYVATIIAPYLLHVNPVLFLLLAVAMTLTSVVNALQSRAYAKAVNPYGDDVVANARKFAKAASAANTAAILILAALVGFVQVPAHETFVQSIVGMALGTLALVLRLLVPWLVCDRLALRSGTRIKPLIAYAIECSSECWVQLAFPHIASLSTFVLIIVVEVASTVASSLWMFQPFQVWVMSALHPARSPHSNWSALRRLQASMSGMVVPADVAESRLEEIGINWMDSARTQMFARVWAQLNGTLAFITIFTLATYSPNSRFFPFHASDQQHYLLLVGFSLLTVLAQVCTMLVMIRVSSVLHSDSAYDQLVDCFQHGTRWLLSSKRNILYTVTLPISICATCLPIFVQQANSLYPYFGSTNGP